MSNYKEGLDSILQAINNLISPQLVNLRYDKTFRGKITNVIDNGLYEVQINGKTYTLPYAGTLQVNDVVKVKSPLNNFSDIYIEAIGGSGGSGGTSNYNDLTNKPILNTNYTSSLTPNSTEVIRGTINLHKVSKTGKYSDLIGVPSLDFISTSQKGVAGGVATLGNDGKVPTTQLPDGIVIDSSYVHTDNNFTTALLTKLNGIEEGAQVNKIETISRNGVTLPITNKNVDIEVPTKTSNLQNDSNFITPDNIIAGNNITLEKNGNNIKINSTGGGGTGTEEVDISETEPTDTGIKLWVDLSDTPSPSGDFTYRYARTFTETIPGGSTIDLPIKYVVGSQLMDVYYNGELLVLSSDETGTDGSYLEIGAEKSYSTQIKITTDWEIYSGDYMEIVMRRHPWDASGIEVIDNLTSTSAVDALSANMGRELKNELEEGVGLNENGTYIKYPNGTMICTKKISGNVDITKPWGILFESNAIGCGKYANEFIETPIISATSTDAGFIIETITGNTRESFGDLYLALPISETNRPYDISLIAIGKWK